MNNPNTTTDIKALYDTQGYVVLPPSTLLPPSTFASLQSAAERTISRTRRGDWPYRRTVGRQFPPFDSSNPDSWGVQHVMHPDLGEPVFVEWYTSEAVVRTVATLVGCEVDELQMELFNMLINPESHDFALRWHRDDVREDATEEQEREALAKWHYGTQWNTALYDDNCLYVVPGSHIHPRTPTQRAHSSSSTLEPPARDPLDMPGAVRVELKAGETIFYNSNILHCATYTSSQKRATLHACMGCVGRDGGGVARARNVLQHGLDWMIEERFREMLDGGGSGSERGRGRGSERGRGREMLGRLVRLRGGVGEVGFSLSN